MIIKDSKKQRQTRIRRTIAKVSDRPRLSVHRSNKYCYVQIVGVNGETIIGVSEKVVKGKEKISPMDSAKKLGLKVAELALAKKIKEVVFDKGSLSYHGRVKVVAEGAREGGLVF